MKRSFGRQGNSGRLIWLSAITAAGIMLAFSGAGASEVYTWTDENGVIHFDDAPPATGESRKIDVPEAYRPGTSGAYTTPKEKEAAPAEVSDETSLEATRETPKSAAEQRREKMAQDREERKKAQAETERLCNLHKQRLEQVEPARRVFYTNDKGESVRMDDDMRVRLVEESKDYLEKNCG